MNNKELIKELKKLEYTNINILKDKITKYYVKAKKNGFFCYLKVYNIVDVYKNIPIKLKILNEIKIGEKIGDRNKKLITFNEKYFTHKYIILEYEFINGMTLKSLPNLNYIKILIIFKNLIKGLLELRSFGIIHRCLKLSNLFIYKNKIKIGGYSNCKIQNHKLMDLKEQEFFLNKYLNNIKALPPEVIMNTYLNYNTSIWSLGIIIYKLLTNKYLLKINIHKMKKDIENNSLEIKYDNLNNEIWNLFGKIFIINTKNRIKTTELYKHLSNWIKKYKSLRHFNNKKDYMFLPLVNIKKSIKNSVNFREYNFDFKENKTLKSSFYFYNKKKKIDNEIIRKNNFSFRIYTKSKEREEKFIKKNCKIKNKLI